MLKNGRFALSLFRFSMLPAVFVASGINGYQGFFVGQVEVGDDVVAGHDVEFPLGDVAVGRQVGDEFFLDQVGWGTALIGRGQPGFSCGNGYL